MFILEIKLTFSWLQNLLCIVVNQKSFLKKFHCNLNPQTKKFIFFLLLFNTLFQGVVLLILYSKLELLFIWVYFSIRAALYFGSAPLACSCWLNNYLSIIKYQTNPLNKGHRFPQLISIFSKDQQVSLTETVSFNILCVSKAVERDHQGLKIKSMWEGWKWDFPYFRLK